LENSKQLQIKLKILIHHENLQFELTQTKNSKIIKTLEHKIKEKNKQLSFNAEVIKSQKIAIKDRQDYCQDIKNSLNEN